MEVNFNELASGAVSEQINRELQKVFENIKDPNTSNTAKRKLNITMTFTPDKLDSEVVSVDIDVKPTLAPVTGVGTRFIVDVDSNGKVVAAEWGKEMKGQISIEDQKEENCSEEETKVTNIVDYQSKAN